MSLPPIGTYWTTGTLPTDRSPMVKEAYATCARCGAFVNAEDRHDEWHRAPSRASTTSRLRTSSHKEERPPTVRRR